MAEDRRREIDRGDQAALVGALRGERMSSTKPADGHPQQFVAGRIGRALHDDLELLARAARRSERADRSTRQRQRVGRLRPAARGHSLRRCAPAAWPPTRARTPQSGRAGRPPQLRLRSFPRRCPRSRRRRGSAMRAAPVRGPAARCARAAARPAIPRPPHRCRAVSMTGRADAGGCRRRWRHASLE